VALTFDACGGQIDTALLDTLERLQVPATLFLTRRWIDRHGPQLPRLTARPALFELQNHGAQHVPAVVGGSVYGLHGPATLDGVEAEVVGGARAVQAVSGQAPRWYRAATARYDRESLGLIERLGLRVAGYSLNADDGARASRETVAARLRRAQPGDIVLAHMNHPGSGTAAGVADALPDLLARGLRFVTLGERAVVPLAPSPAGSGAAARS
jgi:peptidoglycan/xylan/chitin deacetylase (PgdA/CDA1 family)